MRIHATQRCEDDLAASALSSGRVPWAKAQTQSLCPAYRRVSKRGECKDHGERRYRERSCRAARIAARIEFQRIQTHWSGVRNRVRRFWRATKPQMEGEWEWEERGSRDGRDVR